MCERIAAWHRAGMWTDAQVAAAAERGWISAAQYAEIMAAP